MLVFTKKAILLAFICGAYARVLPENFEFEENPYFEYNDNELDYAAIEDLIQDVKANLALSDPFNKRDDENEVALQNMAKRSSNGGGEVEQMLGSEEEMDTNLEPFQQELEKVDKRSAFTVKFMNMQVSYPQYLRLVALQQKVIKLDKLLRRMKARKPIEILEMMPQWHRLVALHASLKKLLPEDYLVEAEGLIQTEPAPAQEALVSKRSGVDFNGVRVSLPQYLRLMALQEKVLKLDTVMRRLSTGLDPEKLAASSKWNRLVNMRQSLQKLLPEDHPEFQGAPMKRTSMNFNGVQVSYPQYVHLMALQKKVMALDAALNKIAAQTEPEALDKMPTWHKLVNLRTALSKLMPQ